MGWLVGMLRAVEITLLKRPRDARDLLTRVIVLTAVVAAGATPFLLTSGSEDIASIAGQRFRALLTELDETEARVAALEDDSSGASDELQALRARRDELEALTFLGYIERPGDAPKAGAIVPDFRLLDLDGNPFRLSDLTGPSMINFWASWCMFCIEEMPDLQRVHERFGDRLTIVGINRGEALATARTFADQTGASYTLLLDTKDVLAEPEYQVFGMPTTLYVSAAGRVNAVVIGFQTFEQMLDQVGALLGEDLAIETTTPLDPGFASRATELVLSQRANYAVAAELFARFEADATVVQDIGWQRNILAQIRAWQTNQAALQDLAPPSNAAALLQTLLDAFLPLEAVAGLLQMGAMEADAGRIKQSIALFRDGFPAFDRAAADLTEFLAVE